MMKSKCTVVNKNNNNFDVYIGRGSKWGNPYTHITTKQTKAEYIVKSRRESIQMFRYYLLDGKGRHLLKDLSELKGKTLGCYCKPRTCHGDLLVELVNNLYYF